VGSTNGPAYPLRLPVEGARGCERRVAARPGRQSCCGAAVSVPQLRKRTLRAASVSGQVGGEGAGKCARNAQMAVSIDARLSWMEDPQLEAAGGSLPLASQIRSARTSDCRWLG
jgi:hypothetical protein